ncbi:MAG: HEAT repeat domain-containing protein [Planctomycetes bacterium]|nr:HEAT repeat domain-containing protein [Planctomycetota bacterium]
MPSLRSFPLAVLVPVLLLVVALGAVSTACADEPSDRLIKQYCLNLDSPAPEVRAVAERALLAAPKERVVRPLLVTLSVGEPDARAFAAKALGRFGDPTLARPLIARVIEDDAEPVRNAAALAAVAAAGKDVAWDLVKDLGSPLLLRRMRAAQGLGVMANPFTVGPIINLLHIRIVGGGGPRAHIVVEEQITYVADYDVEIAANSIAFDPIIKVVQSGTVLDARIHRIERDIWIEEHATYANILRGMTGQDFGFDADRWSDWWDKNADEFTADYRREKKDVESGRTADRMLREARDAEAKEDFEEALRLYRHVEGEFARLAQARDAAGRREALEGSAYVRMKLEERQATANARNWLSMAKSFAANGRPDRAEEFARRVLAIYPDSAEAREARAYVREGGGR